MYKHLPDETYEKKHQYVSALLYRAACCFNLFFIVPTHALHYTL